MPRQNPPALLHVGARVLRLVAVLLGEGGLDRAQQECCQGVDLGCAQVEVGHPQPLEVLALLALVKDRGVLELVLEESLVAVPALPLRLVGLEGEVEAIQGLAALDRQVSADAALLLQAGNLVAPGAAVVPDRLQAGRGHVRIVHEVGGGKLLARSLPAQIGGDVARLANRQAQARHDRPGAHRVGHVRVRRDIGRIADPAHHVVVVHLVPDTAQVGGERSSHGGVALADGVAAHAAARLEQLLAQVRVAARVLDELAV